MFRGVNATAALAMLGPLLVLGACRKADRAADAAVPDAARSDTSAEPAAVAGADAPRGPADPKTCREESARLVPEPFQDLWIGQPLSQVLEDHPDARAYSSPGDPERLAWQELAGPNGLIVRLGFSRGPDAEAQELRSIQFMSLLPAPTGSRAPAGPRTVQAWQQWLKLAYEPHLEALREKYGEEADVYSCAGGTQHPVIRIVWRQRALAVTEAFMLHDKGLSSTLMITPLDVAERYVRATQCRWIQDRVL